MKFLALAAISAFPLLPAPASAGPLEDGRAAYLSLWEQSPLQISDYVFVTSPAQGFGMYETRPNNVFGASEPIYVYVRPEAYGWTDVGGIYEFGLDVGIRLSTEAGELVFEKANFLELKAASLERVTEFFGNITLTLTDFPKGKFVMELDMSDIATDKTATISMPFEVQ